MLSFQFSRISFTKASKYVFLVDNQKQTKRTDVCFSWTSSPTFQQQVQVQQTGSYKIKACQATIDRKLKIVGFTVLQSKDFSHQKMDNNIVFDDDLHLIQVIEGKDIIVGRYHLIVKQLDQNVQQNNEKNNNKQKKQANEQKGATKSLKVSAVNSQANSPRKQYVNSARYPLQSTLNNSKISNLQNSMVDKKFRQEEPIQQIDSDFQLKQFEQQQAQNDCSIKCYVHGGTSFYLGSSFSVQLTWGDKYCQSHYIKDKIIPQWAESLVLVGNEQQSITVNILDQKKNVLEWTRFSLKNVRKIYPYHLKIIFRQQYMGDRPVVYLSFMREDLPRFSILDKQIKLKINYEGQNIRNPLQYLVIQSKRQLQIPKFSQMDLKKYSSFEQVNKFIESFQIGDYNWIDFIPLETGKRSLTLFKSQLNKNLTLFLISIKNWITLFCDLSAKNSNLVQQSQSKRVLSAVSIVQKRQNFQNILKQIYYHQEVHAVGKITQIYCEEIGDQSKVKDNNTWRTMTKNYILRNNLLNTSIKNLQILKTQIRNKGQELIKLKKVLIQVKTINNTLREKQKSTFLNDIKNRKQKLLAQNFKITEIQMMLYEKQAQLDFKKKRNDQMALRMNSLNVIEEDTTQLQQQIIKNAKNILQQQQKIKLFKLMRRQIPKQTQIIGKLQKIFEKKQLDKEMNDLLKAQSQKLQNIKRKKRADLENVYNLVKQKNSHQNSLKNKVQLAQKQLIQLNEYYAKLTGL